jgi:chromosome segregation ATPase
LLNVHLVTTEHQKALSPMLEGLRERLPQPFAVLAPLPEQIEKSARRLEGLRGTRERSSARPEKSSRRLKKSSQRRKKSSERLKKSSQRRFSLKLARSSLRAPSERLLQRLEERRARVEEELPPRSRLAPPLSRARRVGFGRQEPLEGLLERRDAPKSVVSRRPKPRDGSLERL